MSRRRSLVLIILAALAALPGLYARLAGIPLSPPMTAGIAGAAILGASFLLLWACDAAQADISQALALAVVALIAVLPEYAVDMYFTWQAGQHPESSYAHFAIANMTGANRLLIGVAWAMIAVIFWVKTRKPVEIEAERRLELFFLGAATLYAFVIPVKGSLAWYDGIVFLALYGWYIALASRRPCGACEAEGPAELLFRLPRSQRRLATVAMFLFAAGAIAANAAPFCEGLVGTGRLFGVNEFLLVQWLAPIASEAPEFIVAISFALRGSAGMALGSLLSAKLNQWTLLVGMIPSVYALSHRGLEHPIPMGSMQMHEILLTAAQSLLGVVLLATLRLSVWQGLLLFSLFIGQFLTPGLVAAMPEVFPRGLTGDRIHQVFAFLYVASAFSVLSDSPHRLRDLWRSVRHGDSCLGHEGEDALPAPDPNFVHGEGPNCRRCPYRNGTRSARDKQGEPALRG